MANRIQQIAVLGQSIWCDNISRTMIDSGELDRLIDLGITGVTSNPTIFMKAITTSSDYDALLGTLSDSPAGDLEIYEALVLPDIRDGADHLRGVYDRTQGADGYISLEVNPHLAFDTQATIDEARRLFAETDRPNVMIKVPATDEGLPAIETLLFEGINVNVTLIFSLSMYERVMEAYLRGLLRRAAAGRDVTRVASVASFFVSRVDTLVDQRLDTLRRAASSDAERSRIDGLYGKAAIANSKLAYEAYQRVFIRSDAFAALRSHGARPQRPLWASTSTKNPAYRDTLYVDELIGPDTVNTLPPATIEAVLDHARPERTVDRDVESCRVLLERLQDAGIRLDQITDELRRDGVRLFAESFDEVLRNIAGKRQALARA